MILTYFLVLIVGLIVTGVFWQHEKDTARNPDSSILEFGIGASVIWPIIIGATVVAGIVSSPVLIGQGIYFLYNKRQKNADNQVS
jgi:hypothetical protein